MSPHKEIAPVVERRLPPTAIDEIAKKEPSRTWVSVPRTSDPKDGWQNLTYKTLADAIDRHAHRLVAELGPAADGAFPTITYIGLNDIRYPLYAFAAIKAGYQAFFISPRNTEEGQLSLFNATNCDIIYYDASFQSLVQPWLKKRPSMRAFVSPSVEDILDASQGTKPFPYTKSFEQGQWDPMFVLHTSGSTGIPKPIIVRMGSAAAGDAVMALPEIDGCKPWMQEFKNHAARILLAMPMFHAAGMGVFTLFSIYGGVEMVMQIPGRPLSSKSLIEMLTHCGSNGIMLPPSVLEDMSETESGLEALRQLGLVGWGGGNLEKHIGDRLVQEGITVCNFISSTEYLPYPLYKPSSQKDWQYFFFPDEIMGCDWRKVPSEHDMYQQVIVRKEKHPNLQLCFYTFPKDNEFDTKDMYAPHPSKPQLWKYGGRADNIIVFSNGEKLNPITIENEVMEHPDVKGVVVFGKGRFQAGVLIEPFNWPKDEEEADKLLASVWPVIQEVNKQTVAHGRISRSFVRLCKPEKPFPRAGKGTVQLGAALKLYKDEIDEVYEQAESTEPRKTGKLDLASENTLVASLSQLFHSTLGTPEMDPDTDFFTVGVDSLQVMDVTRSLRSGLEAAGLTASQANVNNRDIYSYPTFRKLAAYLLSLSSGKHTNGVQSAAEVATALLEELTKDMPISATGKSSACPSCTQQSVVLTGSTGSLGSYMLDVLIRSRNIAKIVCLNRGEDGGRARQLKGNAERGLATEFAKVEFYQADLSRFDLGIGRAAYADLLSRVDRIVHNAWPVNFNIGVESFRPHIQGVRNLVDFASRCSKTVPITFLSTVATAMHWEDQSKAIPETSLNVNYAHGGYGLSKFVSSMILEEAARESGVPAATIRVGQIGGPLGDKGEWVRQEYLPTLVISSAHLGVLPDSLGASSLTAWMPVETVAQSILELSGATSSLPSWSIEGYYNLTNPTTTSWSETLLPAIVDFFKARGQELAVVPLSEWNSRVEQEPDVAKNPALKLIDTYKGWQMAQEAGMGDVLFSVDRSKVNSKAVANMEPVSPALMQHWCKQWFP